MRNEIGQRGWHSLIGTRLRRFQRTHPATIRGGGGGGGPGKTR